MIVLDAFAVLALLKGEPAASEVLGLLDGARLTSMGLAEVVDHLVRAVGNDEDDVMLDLAELGLLDAVPIEAEDGVRAGLARAEHYHRASCAVSLIDCVAAEVARRRSETLATADPHLLDLCHTIGVAVIALPDSQGQRRHP